LVLRLRRHGSLRAGIADGGGLEFRPPGTVADKNCFDEVKIK